MESITLVKDAIHRPDEPRHFMQFKYPDTQYTATFQGQEIASTKNALVLSEVAYAIYDPVIYFPRADINNERLSKIDKTTHCPLKGDTEYYNLKDTANSSGEEVAWCYAEPLSFAEKLRDYVAFDTRKIKVSAVG